MINKRKRFELFGALKNKIRIFQRETKIYRRRDWRLLCTSSLWPIIINQPAERRHFFGARFTMRILELSPKQKSFFWLYSYWRGGRRRRSSLNSHESNKFFLFLLKLLLTCISNSYSLHANTWFDCLSLNKPRKICTWIKTRQTLFCFTADVIPPTTRSYSKLKWMDRKERGTSAESAEKKKKQK